ncbi:TolC family protein [Polaribacter glomeratus]|uniref:Transporter n=1 Tax=Polaribacter glomeratus TaxID=102 RepID=A0A2S7WH01_9FLAO|nr:TolC family protein [Polaribacter glomeratus]PQJ76893.1 transporter [Polaribacter glomeratus]TXD67263.1 TolC family protein [Polaribacter glomeratus]
MKKYIYLISFFAFTISLKAQEKTMELSLKQAINFALENSYNTKAARNDIRSANEKVWETTAIGLPQVNGRVDYQNFLKQPVSLLPAAAFDNRESVVQTVEDFFDITRESSPNAPDGFIPVVFGTKQNINASVTLTQLLFDGSYLVGLQASKTFLKISKQAEEKTELLTREAVINAYGNVLVTESSIAILESNITILQKNYNDAKKIYENGLNEEEDVEQLEITLGNLKNQLSSVVRMKEIAYQMLNLSLGNPINTSLILTDTLNSLVISNMALSLVSEDFNVNNHIDFKISENDRETKRLMMKLEQSKALPSLNAFVNYGSQGFSDSFTFFNSGQQWFDSSLLGVSLNVPIFSSFSRKSKTAQAKIALENADLRLTETKERLSLLAEKAKSDYQLSIENYTTAQKNLGLSERIEKKQRIKFFEGISSSFDLLLAQNQLYTQQQNYIQSMLAVISKKAALENALNLPIK